MSLFHKGPPSQSGSVFSREQMLALVTAFEREKSTGSRGKLAGPTSRSEKSASSESHGRDASRSSTTGGSGSSLLLRPDPSSSEPDSEDRERIIKEICLYAGRPYGRPATEYDAERIGTNATLFSLKDVNDINELSLLEKLKKSPLDKSRLQTFLDHLKRLLDESEKRREPVNGGAGSSAGAGAGGSGRRSAPAETSLDGYLELCTGTLVATELDFRELLKHFRYDNTRFSIIALTNFKSATRKSATDSILKLNAEEKRELFFFINRTLECLKTIESIANFLCDHLIGTTKIGNGPLLYAFQANDFSRLILNAPKIRVDKTDVVDLFRSEEVPLDGVFRINIELQSQFKGHSGGHVHDTPYAPTDANSSEHVRMRALAAELESMKRTIEKKEEEITNVRSELQSNSERATRLQEENEKLILKIRKIHKIFEKREIHKGVYVKLLESDDEGLKFGIITNGTDEITVDFVDLYTAYVEAVATRMQQMEEEHLHALDPPMQHLYSSVPRGSSIAGEPTERATETPEMGDRGMSAPWEVGGVPSADLPRTNWDALLKGPPEGPRVNTWAAHRRSNATAPQGASGVSEDELIGDSLGSLGGLFGGAGRGASGGTGWGASGGASRGAFRGASWRASGASAYEPSGGLHWATREGAPMWPGSRSGSTHGSELERDLS